MTLSVDYQLIETSNQAALQLKNEPFDLIGHFDPSYTPEQGWQVTPVFNATQDITHQTFPNETYDLATVNQEGFAVGAFLESKPIGLALFQDDLFAYSYLSDLKVNRKYRRLGIGQHLLDAAQPFAQQRQAKGFWTIGQHNNLAACQFYLHYGFTLGGLDTRIYDFTPQMGHYNLHFYYPFTPQD